MKKVNSICLMIVVLGALSAVYEFYAFYTDDIPVMEKESSDRQIQLAKQEAQLKRLRDFARNIEAIKQDLRGLNLQLESALEHMPRAFNLSSVLRKLTMLAQNSGLDLTIFKPGTEEQRKPSSFYVATTLNFNLHGSFTQTLTFFDQVSRLKRIISVDHLAMKPETGLQGNAFRLGNVGLITEVTARTYRFAD